MPHDTTHASHANVAAPSDWVVRWSHLVPAGASVLDVACGSGRHLRWFAQRGARVIGVDRDAAALQACADVGDAELIEADIENGPWPLAGRRFDAVVVTNYLWRPLLARIVDSVDAGGLLLYETFAMGQESVGRPSRPDFLLQPGELLRAAQAGGLRVLGYEDGFIAAPERFVQRIAALRERPAGGLPARHVLPGAPSEGPSGGR
jgi:SAM-dependent methyltransferase